MSKPSSLIRNLVAVLALIAMAAPLVLLVSIYGTRLGFMDLETGLGLVGLKVVPILSWLALGAGVLACLLVLRDRGVWALSLAVLLVGAIMAAGTAYVTRSFGPAPRDVTTNAEDVPAFVGRLAQERRQLGAVDQASASCEGAAAIDSQMASESAAWALERAGFKVLGTSPFRVDGWKEDAFYGVRHDVTVRIRPRRTDIRVSAHDDLPLGNQACALLHDALAAMQQAK